jgi:hypothetical protein
MRLQSPVRFSVIAISVVSALTIVVSAQGPENEAFAKPKAAKSPPSKADAGAVASSAAPAAAPKGVPAVVADPSMKYKVKPGSADCGYFYPSAVGSKAILCSAAYTCCIDNEYNRDNPHCIDLKTDNINCGGCGLKCPTGLECKDGLCHPPAGSIQCDGKWIDGQFDFNNCGSCGHKCKGSLCKDGKCVSCDKGETICENGYGDRRCRNLKEDANNCGKCYHECPEDWDCSKGRCVP